MNIIEVNNLVKHFGEVRAVDGIDFTVEEGSLFAFLGLNGAGKSTTINILCSILRKDAGKVVIDGIDIDRDADKVKGEIGIVFQRTVLDESLTVEDNLKIRAGFYGLRGTLFRERLNEIEEFMSVKELLKRQFSKLSGGQRRRVDIVRGILHRPRILILDEPTTGLDPQVRRDVWNAIEVMRKRDGITVFLTTHYMEEANKSDRVVIMDNGKIEAQDTPNRLKNKYSGDYIFLYSPKSEKMDEVLRGYDFDYDRDRYRILTRGIGEARDFLLRHQEIINDFEVIKGDMDDVFLNVTGKKLSGTAFG